MGETASKGQEVDTMDTMIKQHNVNLNYNINNKRLTAIEEKAKDDLIEKVVVVPSMITQKIERWLLGILQNHYLFCSLGDNQLIQVVRRMIKCTVNADDHVFKMGDRPGAFFIIEKGNVDIEGRGGYKKGNLSRDDSFGQYGLLYNSNRSASIRAKVDCQLWCLTKNNFKIVQKQIVQENYKNSIKYINELQLFEYVTQSQKNSIACVTFALRYPKDTIIYKKNDQASSFFIVKRGEVLLKEINKQTVIKQHSYFGNQCFEQTRKPLRIQTAETLSVVECLSISRQSIKSIMGDSVKQLMNYNILKSALNKSQFFSKLDPINVQKLIHLSKQKHMKNDEIIFEAQRQPSKIVVILYGSGFNQKIGTLLGQDFMLLDRKPSIVIRKQGDGQVAEISYQKIIKILKQTNIQALRKRKYNTIEEESSDDETQINKKKIDIQQKNQSKFQNLTVIKIFQDDLNQHEHILLAQNKQASNFFLIRMISKGKLGKNRDDRMGAILREKQILDELRHPFLTKMIKRCKDDSFLYFVFEYQWCYSLFYILRQIGLLNKSITKFYMASILLALEYLHSKNIVLRDLKPQNIMVYADGYLKINNFSTAKRLQKQIGFRTFTQIGTPHYMAPQILSGKGYSFAVDLWSAGIMFYQFVIGKVPFGNQQDDPYKIQQLILNKAINYPNQYQDQNGKQIIEQLLSKSPELRLCKGFNNLKAHAYFNTINWKKLQKKEQIAPFKSKKFYYGQILPLDTKLHQFILEQKNNLSNAEKAIINDWDEQF